MKSLTAAMLLVLILAGCNAELDQYNKMELGKPVPPNAGLHVASPPKDLDASANYQRVIWQVPSIAASKSFGVVVDAHGNVTAKLYSEVVMEHWLVVQLGAMDWRMDVEVPSGFFHEMSANSQAGRPDYDLRAEVISGRSAPSVAGYLGMVVAEFNEAVGYQQADAPFTLATSFPMAMFVFGRTTWPASIKHEPGDEFRGITKSGFERTIDFRDGGFARIQNLGGRRVRVEFKFFRIIDPFFLIPAIECSGSQPARKVKTNVKN